MHVGLAWLGRRVESWVPPTHEADRLDYSTHKEDRLDYSDWIKKQMQDVLDPSAYTDGVA